MGRVCLSCERPILHSIARSISKSDPGVILVYSASSLVEIEGPHCIFPFRNFG